MKSDYGFDESEKLLNQLEKDVHKQYAQATEEMGKKVDAYFSKFKAEDEKQRAKYEQGEITKKEYTEWRQRKMLTGNRYIQMRDTLAKDLTNTDSIAMRMVGDKMIDTYALNMNYATYQIEHDTRVDTSFTLYNHDSVERLIKTNPAILPIPKPDKMLDYKWNKQHLQSALTQGILQGEAITKIAKRFQSVSGMDERAAIRNARTAMTGAQNGGRLDAMERAKERGIDVKKAWMATLDNRTRDSHVELDGQEQEIDDEFTNGLMFPGDPEGEPAEVYNCRCRMVHVYGKHPVDWSDTSLRNTDKLGDMTYEEWKEAHGAKKEKEETSGIFKILNKMGNQIDIDLPISDNLTGEKRERAIKRTEEATALIENLSAEYNTNLNSVSKESASKTHSAGYVDLAGDMKLSSLSKDTVLHEFGHTLANSNRIKANIADESEKAFMKDIQKMFTEYKEAYAKDARISISSYSLQDKDEFLAEGFALAKAREMGIILPDYKYNLDEHEYSDKILNLIDKYFKKR